MLRRKRVHNIFSADTDPAPKPGTLAKLNSSSDKTSLYRVTGIHRKARGRVTNHKVATTVRNGSGADLAENALSHIALIISLNALSSSNNGWSPFASIRHFTALQMFRLYPCLLAIALRFSIRRNRFHLQSITTFLGNLYIYFRLPVWFSNTLVEKRIGRLFNISPYRLSKGKENTIRERGLSGNSRQMIPPDIGSLVTLFCLASCSG